MIIPSNVMSAFERETENLKFGKVTIGVIVRDGHIHYEIDKHITFSTDQKQNQKDNNKQ